MCLACRLRGSVANCDESGLPNDVSKMVQDLGCLDSAFLGSGGALPIDIHAQSYLEGTLERLRKFGVDLIPITTSTDGSCLPHAVSKAIFHNETLFDVLRQGICDELKDNEDWYRLNTSNGWSIDQGQRDDIAWRRWFDRVLSAAAPVRGVTVGVEKYLENVHILALANLLCRPVLLLDGITGIQETGAEGHGLFPPVRRDRKDIIGLYGFMPGVITIAYANKSHNHFVACCNRTYSTILNPDSTQKNLFQGDFWAEILAIMTRTLQAASHSTRSQEELEVLQRDLNLITSFCHYNPPSTVAQSSAMMLKILTNIDRFLDGAPDPKTGEKLSEKVLQLKLHNDGIMFYVSRVVAAESILTKCGFTKVPGAVGSDEAFLQFGQGLSSSNKVALRSLAVVRRTYFKECFAKLEAKVNVNRGNCNNPHVLQGLADIFKDDAAEQSALLCRLDTLFGRPSILTPWTADLGQKNEFRWFEDMVKAYGTGTIKEGYCWSLSNRYDNDNQILNRKRNYWYLKFEKNFEKLVLPQLRKEFPPPVCSTSSIGDIDNAIMGTSTDGLTLLCPTCGSFPVWIPALHSFEHSPYEYLHNNRGTKRLCPKCATECGVECSFAMKTFEHIASLYETPEYTAAMAKREPNKSLLVRKPSLTDLTVAAAVSSSSSSPAASGGGQPTPSHTFAPSASPTASISTSADGIATTTSVFGGFSLSPSGGGGRAVGLGDNTTTETDSNYRP